MFTVSFSDCPFLRFGRFRLQVIPGGVELRPKEFPAIRQETGLLDSLGRLDPADKSVPISRLVSTLFLAQNASPRDANSGTMISESSSIGWSLREVLGR
jgi:hypothetical protein